MASILGIVDVVSLATRELHPVGNIGEIFNQVIATAVHDGKGGRDTGRCQDEDDGDMSFYTSWEDLNRLLG
jgi:hypothetical protein